MGSVHTLVHLSYVVNLRGAIAATFTAIDTTVVENRLQSVDSVQFQGTRHQHALRQPLNVQRVVEKAPTRLLVQGVQCINESFQRRTKFHSFLVPLHKAVRLKLDA